MTTGRSWAVYPVLSVFFGALVAILGKIGVRDVDSNLAAAVRTCSSSSSLGESSSRVALIDKLSVARAFIFLGEKPTTGNVLAAILVTAGVLVAVFVR